MYKFLIIAFLILAVLVTYSLCRIAGLSDEKDEELINKIKD